MPSFETQITIDAPVERVWAELADLGNIAAWNPGVKASRTTTDQVTGVGAGRHCDVKGGYLREQVRTWEEGRTLVLDVVDTNLPLKYARPGFHLDAQGDRTSVRLTQEYALKFGAAGALMDRLFVNRQMRGGMRELLEGLKTHVETKVRATTRVSPRGVA